MIITKEDFFEMGFTADDPVLLERCIKRAEFVLNGLTGNRALVVAAGEGAAADFVKQAAAFQTDSLYKKENALAAKKTAAPGQSESSSNKTEERVSIGDFSYSTGTSESSSSGTTATNAYNEEYVPLDRDRTVIRLLRAAGCLYCGTEVLE